MRFLRDHVILKVSINSTSEEVRRLPSFSGGMQWYEKFPLIQLPRKSEAQQLCELLQQPPAVSINSTSEEVRRVGF